MRYFLFTILIITVIVLSACSHGGNIVSPDSDSAGDNTGFSIVNLAEPGGVFDATGLMGAYELYLDTENLTTDLVLKRSSSVGEDFIVSGLGYWIMAPCTNCLNLEGIMPDDDLWKVTFNISHPFQPGNPADPPSGKNRLDLDIFDVALTIAPRGGSSDTYSLLDTDVYTTFCANADGYTTELANLINDDAACPYFLVIDDSDLGTSSWNKFAMGTGNLFDAYFNEGGSFDLYLTMGYGASAKFEQRLYPKYYNPEFNRNAAWKINVIPPNGDDPPEMGNTWDTLDTTTTYPVTVEVYDWQIGATVYSNPSDFENAPVNNVYAASEVEEVGLEIPGMYDALFTADTADSGTGMPNDPLIFSFDVANENGLTGGTYTGLVKVTDERPPLSEAQLRDFLVHCGNGIDRTHHNIPEFATYQTFPAHVMQGCGPITGEVTAPDCPRDGVYNGSSLPFSAEASSDNGGDPIVLYEWDQDYDGVTFDVDSTGESTILGPFDNPTCGTPDEQPVTYTVAVRATDSCEPPNTTIFATCDIIVDNCAGAPIQSVNFFTKDVGDEYFDVCVAADSYVYVVADHPDTGNEGLTRTALRWDNDLTNYTVMEEGDGINDPEDFNFSDDRFVHRIDISDSDYIIWDPGGVTAGVFTDNGTTFTTVICCARFSCVGYADFFPDVWHQDDEGSFMGSGCVAYEDATIDCEEPTDCTLIFPDSDPFTLWTGGAVNQPYFYDPLTVKAVEGLEGTENALFLISDDTVGYISESGTWLSQYSGGGTLEEIATYGSLGTADGEFTGGLDIAIDSTGNVVTLEDHGMSYYRFQKFDSDMVHVYSSQWMDDGEPLRMDFDRADDYLYLISTTGLHIMEVQ